MRRFDALVASVALVQRPTSSDLSLSIPLPIGADPAREDCLRHAIDTLGEPASWSEHRIVSPVGAVTSVRRTAFWHGEDTFSRFRDFVLATDPWPDTSGTTFSLYAPYRFLWRDPDGNGPLEDQAAGHNTADGALWCSCVLQLQRRTRVLPDLWFPYEPGDPRLNDLVSLSSTVLPFALRPNHFRRAVPFKNRLGYRETRFDATGLITT